MGLWDRLFQRAGGGPAARPAEQQLQEQVSSAMRRLDVLTGKLSPGALSQQELREWFGEIDDLVDPLERFFDGDEYGTRWYRVGTGSGREGDRLPVNLDAIRRQARLLAEENGFAVNAHENRISYIVGKSGHSYTAVARKDEDPSDELLKRVQRVLDDWTWKNRWGARQEEILKRRDRDGECFLRFFETTDAFHVRFVEPEDVQPPESLQSDPNWSHGIHTAPDDVETVIEYGVAGEIVPADQIQHRKANVDATIKRGMPLLYPVRGRLRRIEEIDNNAGLLIKHMTSIVEERKHTATPKAGVQAIVDKATDATRTNPFTGRSEQFRFARGGQVRYQSDNVESEFPGVHASALGAIEFAQHLLRGVAARLVMPEFMFTSNARNNNQASATVAEGPAVKKFEREQQAMVFDDLDVLWRMIRWQIARGGLPPEVETLVEIVAEPPTVATRDRKAEEDANAILYDKGVLSLQTWSQKAGLDYDQEQTNLRKHQEAYGAPAAAATADNDDADPPADSDRDSKSAGIDPALIRTAAESISAAFAQVYP